MTILPLLFIETVHTWCIAVPTTVLVPAVQLDSAAKTVKNIPPFGGQQIPHAIFCLQNDCEGMKANWSHQIVDVVVALKNTWT